MQTQAFLYCCSTHAIPRYAVFKPTILTFPGVLMIELSKMGGNPIGPYGDTNNIYNVFHDNIDAINMLIKYFKNKDLIKERIK